MKKLMMILAAFSVAAALNAQNLDPTVEVSRVYEGKLIEVRKPVMEMNVPDTLYRFDLDFDYSVFENPYRGAYEFNPYTIDMRPESNLEDPSKFYLRAGAGYTLHPVFDLLWTPELKKGFSVDVYGMHRSYVGGYRAVMGHEAFKGYDLLSKAGADFGYDWQKASVDFGASYYGVAVKDDIFSRSYNAVDAYFSLASKSLWPSHFMYKLDVAYRYADDVSVLPLYEHDLSIDAVFGPSFSERDKVFFDLGVEMNAYSPEFFATAARFYMVPHYVYKKGSLELDLGVRFSAAVKSDKYQKDKVKNQIVYPDIRMNLALIPDAMRFYVNIGGGEKLNSYASFIDRNHHIRLVVPRDSPDLMQPSIERVSSELGIEGRISGFFSYNLRGGYSNMGYAPLEAVSVAVDGRVGPYFCFTPYQRAYAALDWDLNVQNVRFDGILTYTHVWGMNNNDAFKPATLTGDVEFVYNWRKRVYAGADCEFSLARINANGLKVPFYADLGIFAEYEMNNRLSFWIRGGNLLNMEIQRELMYAEKGINFTAGLCLNF